MLSLAFQQEYSLLTLLTCADIEHEILEQCKCVRVRPFCSLLSLVSDIQIQGLRLSHVNAFKVSIRAIL